MRKQLQEGETEMPAPSDSDEANRETNFRITLEAMGLKIGDRVIVGGVKVRITRAPHEILMFLTPRGFHDAVVCHLD